MLNVTHRFAGEEPTGQVTGLNNQIMAQELPKAASVIEGIRKAGNVIHY